MDRLPAPNPAAGDTVLAPPALVLWLAGAPDEPLDEAAVEAAVEALITDWKAVAADPEGAEARALIAAAEMGWLIAAAGISRVEAEAQVLAGTLDWRRVEVLAGLRGFPVPATG